MARRPSEGRWRVIGTNITFTEPNEVRAIPRFLSIKRGEEPLPLPYESGPPKPWRPGQSAWTSSISRSGS